LLLRTRTTIVAVMKYIIKNKKLHPYAFIPFSHGVSRVIAPIEKILLSIVIAPLTIGIVVTLSCYKKT
jgi:hypothetical protein